MNAPFTSYKQYCLPATVIINSVCDTSASRENCNITGSHIMKHSVNPGMHMTLYYQHKLLFKHLGMRQSRTMSWRQNLPMQPNTLETRYIK